MKGQDKNKVRVYVAMSGGVDSSVAAALLKKRGFDVVGVFMKPWQPEISKSSDCLWQKDREDAMRVAAVLEIPLLTWDFSKEYKKVVTDYMIKEYKSGRTPNPDVRCNKEIKFGLFLKRALGEGADYVATGHYVRLLTNNKFIANKRINELEKNHKFVNSKQIRYSLMVAKDKNKDQSYFLWTLTQDQLKHCLFPIGDYIKPEVRKMAKKFGLPTYAKKDSQGVCFVGPLNIKEFLKSHIKPKRGEILDTKNNLVGSHDGIFYYTIGQRRGLDIKNGKGPYFVVKKDVKKNIIYVGKEDDLRGAIAKIININWINNHTRPYFLSNDGHRQWNQWQFPVKINVKIRYRSKSTKATLFKNGILRFKKFTRAITPGQSAVFYKKEEVLGGGIIN